MSPQPLSFPRGRRRAVQAGLVLLSLAGAACSSEDLPLPTGADPGAPMTTVHSPELAAELVPNSWTRRIQMPTARAGLVAAKANGLIYAIGGWRNGTAVQTVEAYDYNTTTLVPWIPRAPLPAARQFPNGAAVINGKIYVAGGLTVLGPTRSLYVYNVAANSWSTMKPMPVRSYGGAAAAIDGKLWVVVTTPGDSGRYIDPARIFRYDPATDSWSEREPAPNPHHLGAVGVINGKIYVAGGKAMTDFSDVSYQYDWAPVATLDEYDPATNVWTPRQSMPTARSGAAAGVIDGKFFVAGGTGADGSARSTMEMYDPATNTWAPRAKMPTARTGVGAAVVGAMLHVMGGTSGPDSDALKTNESYRK